MHNTILMKVNDKICKYNYNFMHWIWDEVAFCTVFFTPESKKKQQHSAIM